MGERFGEKGVSRRRWQMPGEMSTTDPGSEHWWWRRAEWWWLMHQTDDEQEDYSIGGTCKSCSASEVQHAEKSDVWSWGRSKLVVRRDSPLSMNEWMRKLHSDEIAHVTRRKLEELIILCRGKFIGYPMRSCTLSQCRDLKIFSGLHDLSAATTARARAFLMCLRRFNCYLGIQ